MLPEPAHELLVHQQLLHLGGPLREGRSERLPGEHVVERIDREVLELLHLAELVRGGDEHLAERARIHVAEVAALLEREHDVRVRRERHALVRADELAAHPEVRHEHVAVVHVQQDVLAAALGLGELAPDEQVGELLALAVPADHPHRVLRRTYLGLGRPCDPRRPSRGPGASPRPRGAPLSPLVPGGCRSRGLARSSSPRAPRRAPRARPARTGGCRPRARPAAPPPSSSARRRSPTPCRRGTRWP